MTRYSSRTIIVLLAGGFVLGSSIASVSAEVPARPPGVRELTLQAGPPQGEPPLLKGLSATTRVPEDFYYYGPGPVRLDRSLTELVVRFRPGPVAARQRLVETLAASATVGTELQVEGRTFQVVTIPPAETGVSSLSQAEERLRADDSIEFVAPVLVYPATGSRLLPTDEIVVKLKAGGTRQELADVAAPLGLSIVRMMWGTQDELVLRLDQPRLTDPLERSRQLQETGRFEWAEPNFIQEYQKSAVPNDPRFGQQWHLSNTGQGGGTAGADVKAPAAWDLQPGSSSITIAVIDAGVEKTHEDLAANIFLNPGEIPNNGIDDDANGYVDDVSGWDFSSNDNDASPFAADDNHGTAVAGVAAGRGDNGVGISGACQNCRILPIKIFLSTTFAGDTAVANAIRYASSLADVLNNSWGGGAPSSVLQSAIQSAVTTGRGGKGSPVLSATGNSASGNVFYNLPSIPAGTHRFRWEYLKDSSLSGGDDTAWLSWVQFPGGARDNFESGVLPAGWTTGGSGSWSVVSDARHSEEGACFVHAAKAGTITHSQATFLDAVKTVTAGTLYFQLWVSSESGFDGVRLVIDYNNDGTADFTSTVLSGVPIVAAGVSYPAAYPESIAVGASSNFDCRSHYSQFGPELDVVAPSSAGPLNLKIESTDRTGAAGYDPGNYTLASGSSGFGGTSSATPLAAGVAGLILSRNPSLTAAQVRQSLESTADKIGPEPYVAGRNDRYGFGRLDAEEALLAVASCTTLSVSPATLPSGIQGLAYSQNLGASGGTPPYGFVVTVGTLPPGLTLSGSGLLSGTPSASGIFTFTATATDASGCSGFKAYSLVVNGAGLPAISIGDVSVAEGDAGTSSATFTVSLSAASPNTVSVDYTTANGTATADSAPLPGPWAGSTAQSLGFSFTVLPGGTQIQPLSYSINSVGCGVISTTTISAPPFDIAAGQFSRSGSTGCTNYSLTGQFSSAMSASGTVGIVWQNLPGCPCTGSQSTTWTTTPTRTVSAVAADAVESDTAWPGQNVAAHLSTGTPGDSGIHGTAPALAGPATSAFTEVFVVDADRRSAIASGAGDMIANLTGGADYLAALGTLSFPPGTTSKTISVAVGGDTAVEPNETFFVNLSGATNATITDAQGVGTINNDDAAIPTLSINDVVVAEGNSGTTSATFTVSLSAASGQTVTVNYATANGSATAGSDYVGASGTLTFLPGSTTQILPVTVNGDTAIESNETFVVNLSGATNATIADTQGGGTIVNDDSPALSVNDVAVTEGNSGTTSATFTVSLSAASGQTVTVNYATTNSSATAGSDYVAASGTLTFPPGSTTQSLPITVNGDTAIEPTETFFVNLSGATSATIADAQGVGTIGNDDGSPATSFYTVTPCRVLDTRDPDGALGGPALQPGAQRTFALAGPKCAIPATATAVSINITVTGATTPGNVRLFPPGVAVPLVSTINFIAGQTRANNAVVQVGDAPTASVVVLNGAAGPVHFILDVNGYFE